ncbi:MAG: hypothetical protein QM533_10975 [Cytophagales bacterium]|nr:hypothetical protein [Cytophagales bacterium]
MTKPVTTIKDVLALFEQTNAMLQENAAAQAKTEIQLAQTQKELAESFKNVNKQLGGIGVSQGLVAEEFFYNTLLDKPQIGSLKFDQINMNMQGGKKSDRFECDIAAINGKSLALIEVKYNVHEDAVEQVESHVRRFRKFFPYYAKRKIYGGVAGFHISKDVAELAHKKGFFVLKRKGEAFTASTADMKAF